MSHALSPVSIRFWLEPGAGTVAQRLRATVSHLAARSDGRRDSTYQTEIAIDDAVVQALEPTWANGTAAALRGALSKLLDAAVAKEGL